MRALGGLVLAVWLCACEAVATAPTPATSTPAPAVGSPTAPISAPRSATPAPTRAPMWGPQACEPDAACNTIADTLNRISLAKLNDQPLALTGVGSRDPRHRAPATAVPHHNAPPGA